MIRTTSSQAKHKAQWMGRFEAVVNAQEPTTVGRIKWDDAIHLYNSGYTPADAAERYLSALRNS